MEACNQSILQACEPAINPFDKDESLQFIQSTGLNSVFRVKCVAWTEATAQGSSVGLGTGMALSAHKLLLIPKQNSYVYYSAYTTALNHPKMVSHPSTKLRMA